MLGRVRQWWGAQKEWRRAHVLAFAEVAARDAEGITIFQRRLVSAMSGTVPPESFKRAVSKDGTVYLVAEVPGTALQLYVYANAAGLGNVPRRGLLSDGWEPYEEWAFRTPDELINAVVGAVGERRAV